MGLGTRSGSGVAPDGPWLIIAPGPGPAPAHLRVTLDKAMRIHVPHGLRARIGVDVGDQVVLLREGTWLMIASAAILAPMIRWANTVRRSRNDAREAGSDGGSFVMAAPTVEVILRLMDAENLTIADLEQARHGKGITVAEYLDEALAP